MSEHEAIRKALVHVRQMPGNMTDPVQRVIKVFESQEAYRRATNPDAISALLADRDRLAAEVEAKWKPIETAPRSAESILTINQSGRMAIETGYYAHNMMHAAQLDEEECYYTHWMPLPASPEEGTS